MKKQSFYVWFLGAQEARGVGDERSVRPALQYLLEREKDIEPTKVTLQVSGKGLKIVQNIVRSGSKTAKKEQMKHLIPPHSLRNVMQADPPHDDMVCCTLLIYNPVTKCPLHVHAYRCDSVETACSLRCQLAQLMEHGQKAADLVDSESRLAGFSPPSEGQHMRPSNSVSRAPHSGAARKQQQQQQPPIGSDGRSTRTDEEDPDFEGDVDDDDDHEIGKSIFESYGGAANSGFDCPVETTTVAAAASSPAVVIHENVPREACEVLVPQDPQMARLYDSLAQELKAKLAFGLKCKAQKAPLLLPPKDYDTVCRKQGNLMGIDFRRSTNQNIIGRPNSKNESVPEAIEDDDDKLFRNDSQGRNSECLITNLPPASSSGKSSSGKRAEKTGDERFGDEWNSRSTERHEMCSDVKLRPRHRSLDFVQQRLDHFHMGELKRTTSETPERYRGQAVRDSKSQSKQAMATYFGQQRPVQPLRPLSNNASNHPSLDQLPKTKPPPPQTMSQTTCFSGSGPFSLPPNSEPSRAATAAVTRVHQERPISFPSGVIPFKRDTLSPISPQSFSFHQHPVRESMIEPVVNNNHRHYDHQQRQRRRSSPGTRNAFELHLNSNRRPDSKESKSAYIPTPRCSPAMGYLPENLRSPPPPERSTLFDRPTDYRRQSLVELGPHSGRNPLVKYLFNSPLERGAFRSRYSVAESNGHRFY